MSIQQRAAFNLVLDEASRQTFEWGKLDCAILAMKAYEAVTGNPSPVAITWSTEQEAEATLSSMGGIRAAFTVALGPDLPVTECVRGDILLADINGTVAVGVHDGARMLAVAGPDRRGLIRVPWPCVVCGWGVV